MYRCLFTAVFFAFTLTFPADSQSGPKDAVVLIIRHGEKPDTGRVLSPAGQERAEAYKDYFQKFTVDSKPLRPDAIFAAKDTNGSERPRLTVEPFAKAAQLPIDARFSSNQSAELAAALRATEQGKRILISGITRTFRTSSGRSEQNPRACCLAVSGPIPSSTGSSCSAMIRTAV